MSLLLLFAAGVSDPDAIKSISSAESVPGPDVTWDQVLSAGSIATAEALGGPSFTGSVTVAIGSIATGEALGAPNVFEPLTIAPRSIPSGTGWPTGPNLVQTGGAAADDYLPRITVAVHGRDGAELVDLPDSWGRTWMDPLNDTGNGELMVQNDDSALPSVPYGSVLRFKLDGLVRFAALVEGKDSQLVAPAEEVDEATRLGGRGVLAMWEEALIQPSRGADSKPIEDNRLFSWMSLSYDDSSWINARALATQRSAPIAWAAQPVGWPGDAGGAYWIWGRAGTLTWAPPGLCYFRKEFTVPAGVSQLQLFVSGDNAASVYFDGQPVVEVPLGGAPYAARSVLIDVTPGTHLIAALGQNGVTQDIVGNPSPPPSPETYTVVPGDTLWGIATRYYGDGRQWRVIYDANQAQIQADATTAGLWNPYDPGHWIFPGQVFTIPGITRPGEASTLAVNPGGFIAAAFAVEPGGAVGDLLVQTDSTWKMLDYPASPPGMTPGEVLLLLLAEAQLRGGLEHITTTFTEVADSRGDPWPVVGDLSFRVGLDLLSVIKQLCETYMDVWAAPASLALYAYANGRGGITTVDVATGELLGLQQLGSV